MIFEPAPTLRLQTLYIFVILNHSRRQVVHFAVTAHPTTAWVIQQLREAMPFGHLKRLLTEFIEEYYHLARPHQGLNGDTPVAPDLNLRPM